MRVSTSIKWPNTPICNNAPPERCSIAANRIQTIFFIAFAYFTLLRMHKFNIYNSLRFFNKKKFNSREKKMLISFAFFIIEAQWMNVCVMCMKERIVKWSANDSAYRLPWGCIKISRIEMHFIKANSQLKFLIYSRRSEKTKLHIVFCTKFAHLHVFIIIGLHLYGFNVAFFSPFFV